MSNTLNDLSNDSVVLKQEIAELDILREELISSSNMDQYKKIRKAFTSKLERVSKLSANFNKKSKIVLNDLING